MAAPTETLDLDHYLPFYWTAIANRWTSSSSRTYLQRFGVGVVEWRVLATLGALGTATSLDASRLATLDPGAASRAINNLHRKAFVSPVAGRFAGRSKPFAMTATGRELFEAMSRLARRQEATLLHDLSAAEQEQLLALLRRIYDRLPSLDNG